MGKPGGVVRVADVDEESVPGTGGHAGRAAFSAGVLDQVIRDGIAVDLAHTSSDRAERGGGAMQFLGGVGQGLLKPVVRCFCLLLAGAVARCGGAQQAGAERGAAAEPGHIQCRGEHRPRVRVAVLASCQRATSCGAAARVWVSP